MERFTFPGTYEDDRGIEALHWEVRASDRPGYRGRYEIHTTVRGVNIWGTDFDGLEPDEPGAADLHTLALSATSGELIDCVLTGDLPCQIEVDGTRVTTPVHFEFDFRTGPDGQYREPKFLRLSIAYGGRSYEITDDWFEDGTLRLNALLQPAGLVCCVTCLYSDYSPGGHGLMGMYCHRDAKAQYLAVRSKADYWPVPVTEDVPETYICDQYEHRIPGTGYRG